MVRAMRRILRGRKPPSVEQAEAAAALWDRFLPKPADIITWLALFFGGGVGMTYMASVTDWLAAWGPVAWGAIGIGFGGVILLLFAFAGRVRDRRAEPALAERVATGEAGLARAVELSAQLDRLASEVRQAVQGLAEQQAAVAALDQVLKDRIGPDLVNLAGDVGKVSAAIQEAEQRQEASETQLKAEIARLDENMRNWRLKDLETNTNAVTHLATMIGDVKAAMMDAEQRVALQVQAVRDDVADRFSLRDADMTLQYLDKQIVDLSDKLLKGDRADYSDEQAWQNAFAVWRMQVTEFWTIADRWGSAAQAKRLPDLFKVEDWDYRAVVGSPGPVISGDFVMQQKWRWAVIIVNRHQEHADVALWDIHARARNKTLPDGVPWPRSRP